MKRIQNAIPALILGLTFLASLASMSCAVRYYDADHRDYHRWDGGEDRAYHAYWGEAHPRDPYRDYGRLNAGEQRDYWNWRHAHADAGRGRDRNDGDRNDRDRH